MNNLKENNNTTAIDNIDLNAIEKELSLCAQADVNNWVKMFDLMEKVNQKELYKPKYKSFSAWMNHISGECKMHVSTLWARRKAGKVYSEFKARCEKKGISAAELKNISVSPDSLNLCATVAGKNADELDSLITKTVNGELKREDLRKAAQLKKMNSENKKNPTRHDKKELVEDLKEGIKASDIVLALTSSHRWIRDMLGDDTYFDLLMTPYKKSIYEGFPEFQIPSGTSKHARRIDYMVFENLTQKNQNDICIHGIEIKVDKYDLLKDEKMSEYTYFCDAFYIAIPDTEEMIEAAYSYIDAAWGIITVEKGEGTYSFKAKVIKKPIITEGVFRDKSLSFALVKKLKSI